VWEEVAKLGMFGSNQIQQDKCILKQIKKPNCTVQMHTNKNTNTVNFTDWPVKIKALETILQIITQYYMCHGNKFSRLIRICRIKLVSKTLQHASAYYSIQYSAELIVGMWSCLPFLS